MISVSTSRNWTENKRIRLCSVATPGMDNATVVQFGQFCRSAAKSFSFCATKLQNHLTHLRGCQVSICVPKQIWTHEEIMKNQWYQFA